MRVIRYNFLFVIGLTLTLGLSTVLANGGDDKKPKDTGTLTVRTSPVAMSVIIDGVEIGLSGVGTAAEFYLPYGFHRVEVVGPDGKKYQQHDIEIRKDRKVCICLKVVENTISRPCPYRFHLEGPERIMEGDLVTFAAIPEVKSPIPLRYGWKVDNGRITSGLGTPSITVDSANMGGRTIDAELDVNDDVYDGRCRQVISVPTAVGKLPPPITPIECDTYQAKKPDEDKARFDNCVIQLQNIPDAQLYVIIYPGTDKISTTRNTYDKLSKLTLDYIVKTRGIDPRRVTIVKGSPRTSSAFEIWIVPPGAPPPVPR